MWTELKTRLAGELTRVIREKLGVEHAPVLEVPPRRDLGDLASPAAMQLARSLKRNPRAIAEEIAASLERLDYVRDVQVQGAGYLNFWLDRAAIAAALLDTDQLGGQARPGQARSGQSGRSDRMDKILIEHTNINPNKAAHIGHLRNAVLGDVLARSLRGLGFPVEVQNYIDDTGVQVADVVVGFIDIRGLSLADIEAIPEPFDFYCWDLYSEVGRWYEENPERQKLRRATLHEMEIGQGDRAAIGRLVARRIVRRHLATMRRIDVGYDLLTRESEVLGRRFFEKAFGQLKQSGAVRLEKDGKNAGCWVMPLAQSEEFAGLEDPDKVIIRSDGTVTYVGKDIAYQLWKFGLLGEDFVYGFWDEEKVWETVPEGAEGSGPTTVQADHPPFGQGRRVINVIDARQSYLQKIVRAGLEALDHKEEAERSIHFAYEMVTLTPATARALGYLAADDDSEKALEMSGRKGIGVKADDLLDQLITKGRAEAERRNPELSDSELDRLGGQVAVAALRFFMTKATTNRVIGFDLDEALNFEGESGPYIQYAAVRVHNIRRRLREAGLPDGLAAAEVAALPGELLVDELWDLILEVAQIAETVEKGAESLELSLIARQTLELAQKLNALYRKHPILKEPDPQVRAARLATVLVFRRGIESLCGLLGIPIPDRM